MSKHAECTDLTITVFGVILTLTYIYPINDVLFFAQTDTGASLGADELKALSQRWIWTDRLRLIVTSIGYLALLRAFSVPLTKN
jgi:hypothetical protein